MTVLPTTDCAHPRLTDDQARVRSELHVHQQQVFDLYYLDRVGQVEIARRLAVTQPAVSSRLATIRRRFERAGVGLPPAPFAAASRELVHTAARRVIPWRLLSTEMV